MAVQDFASRSGLTPRAAEAVLEQLAQCRRIRQVVGHVGKEQLWVSEEAYSGLKRRAVEELEALFRRDRLARGMARAEFARRVFPRCAGPLIQRCVAWLEEEKCICVDDELVSLPGRTLEPIEAEAHILRIIEERFRQGGLSPPTADEVKAELATASHDIIGVQDALRYLVGAGRLVRLPNQDLLSALVVEDLRVRLRQSGWKTFSIVAFKDTFGLTRRWAIPILEYCDAAGITRREGPNRVIVTPP